MEIFSNELSYEICEDGYDIYLNGTKWICQHEPYIPFPDFSYEENAIKQCEELDDTVNPVKILQRLKESKINDSKTILKDFLEKSYIELEMHGGTKKYSVTEAKQNLLSSLIQRAQYCVDNNIEFHPMWNSKDDVSEEYTLEELNVISVMIYNFVQVYVKKQQELEKQISLCETEDALNEITIENFCE